MFHEEAKEGGDEEAGEEEAGQSSVQQGTFAERANIQERSVEMLNIKFEVFKL